MNVFDDDLYIAIGASIVFGIFFLIIFGSIEESKKWEKFKASHKCEVVAKISGDFFNTFGMDSKGNPTVGIGSAPNKTGWKCDDGITYYR